LTAGVAQTLVFAASTLVSMLDRREIGASTGSLVKRKIGEAGFIPQGEQPAIPPNLPVRRNPAKQWQP
jgi:hypothetical protein